MNIGILGGGQLGQMLALAGYPLGLRFRFFDPAADCPVDVLAPRIRAEYDDLDALARFADGLDVVTYEFENVPVEAVQFLAGRVRHVYPPVSALEVAQDRALERAFFEREGIPGPAFEAVDSEDEFRAAIDRVGLPAVLKTRRFGYDGKGQAVIRVPEEIAGAWQSVASAPCVVEAFVPFDRELSIIAVRDQQGAIVTYPLPENRHRAGILRTSIAPAPELPPGVLDRANRYAATTLEELQYVGALAIEFFLVGDQLLANEIAPRVHNSGHWTIEGAAASQFENHVRACAGLPLGSPAVDGYVAMVNLIGTVPDLDAAYRLPDTHVHLYGKSPRPGRKLGHVTLRAHDLDTLHSRLAQLAGAGFEVQ
jgi:5-(carboxyamino)imidazole ribonucleotide synthase